MRRRTRHAVGALAVLVATAAVLSGCTAANPQPVPTATATAVTCPAPSPSRAAGASWPIDALALPPRAVASGAGVTVAVIDSGLAPGRIPDGSVAPESTSLVDGEALSDDDGHGTEMAELVVKVAPDVSILALKAVDRSGQARMDWIVKAVRLATSSHADVISLSLETPVADAGLESALTDAASAGATIVIAAGNQQLDLDRFPRYPASYPIAVSLVVAASDRDGALAAATNWGAQAVDLAAPGDAIPVVRPDGTTAEISGSSPAAALTAGAVALLLSADAVPATPLLVATAAPSPALAGKVSSGGTLDVAAALACATAR